MNSKCVEVLNVSTETMGNRREKKRLVDIGFRIIFFITTQKSQAKRIKINMWEYNKLKTYAQLKKQSTK